MAEKNNILPDCIFYKGGDECPKSVMRQHRLAYVFWSGEYLYCRVADDEEEIKESESFYRNCGLEEEEDGIVPNLLKACIFQAFCRHSDNDPMYDAEFFKANVLPEYVALHIKKNRMSYCKAYKGEDRCPFEGDRGLIWQYEKFWVEHNQSEEYSNILEDYLVYGLRTFRDEDGTPIELKALIWSRYAHWSGVDDIEGFKRWYNDVVGKLDKRE